jgi:hypothetical protein
VTHPPDWPVPRGGVHNPLIVAKSAQADERNTLREDRGEESSKECSLSEDYWDAALVNPVFTRLAKFAEVFMILLHERLAICESEEP